MKWQAGDSLPMFSSLTLPFEYSGSTWFILKRVLFWWPACVFKGHDRHYVEMNMDRGGAWMYGVCDRCMHIFDRQGSEA